MISALPCAGLVSIISLWVLGGAAVCIVGRCCTSFRSPLMLVHFFTGGYLAHVVGAFIILNAGSPLTPHATFKYFPILFAFVILAGSLQLIRNAHEYLRKREVKSSINIYTVVVFTALVITLLAGLNMSFSSPISGWDTLQLHAQKATQFLQSGSMVSAHHWENRHPPTIPSILAIPYFADSTAANYGTFASLTWWGLWVANAFLVFGCCTSGGLKVASSGVVSIVSVTIPIVENHVLIPGYTELFVGIALLATVVYCLE